MANRMLAPNVTALDALLLDEARIRPRLIEQCCAGIWPTDLDRVELHLQEVREWIEKVLGPEEYERVMERARRLL